MLLLGAGPRALLLQLAHPAVAAGVADHSDFRADPWRRLAGTLRSYLTDRVRDDRGGPRRDPPPQHAPPRDHRTGLRGARPGARRCGSTPRSSTRRSRSPTPGSSRCRRARRAAFYDETRPIGRAFGVPDAMLPGRPRGVRAYVADMLGAGRPGARLGGRARAGGGRPATAARAARAMAGRDPGRRSTPGRCGRRSGCCRRRSARSTAWPGVRASASSRPGSWPAGGPGVRSCRRRSARCPRRSPRTGGSRAAAQ